MEDYREHSGEKRQFSYDGGKMLQAGNLPFKWDGKGRMIAIARPSGTTGLRYDSDNRLAEAQLPNGALVRYEYGDGLMPVRISVNGNMALEYTWERHIHLTKCVDRINGLVFYFEYAEKRLGGVKDKCI